MARPNFFTDLALGRYYQATSPLHKASASGKALVLSLIALGSFWLTSAVAFGLLGLGLALTAKAAKIPQPSFWRSIRPLISIALFTIVAGLFFQGGEATAFSPSPSWLGLQKGGLYAARLLLITLLSTIFFFTTPTQQAVALGIRLLWPLRLLGIEEKELALLVHLAYRFVPLLTREIEEMQEGRWARGLAPPKGLGAKLKEGYDILVSLFVSALQRAETSAITLEERGLIDSFQQASLVKGQGLGLGLLWLLLAAEAMLIHFGGQLI